ncbi:MAG: ABC transporter substrate-binding protein [Myxococcales bacterium]|nr:ABC transporter substrate-binding protein [Myxococcales bacterium]
MRKPEHQWETRHHRARRRTLAPGWEASPRAESFDLEPLDGGAPRQAHLALDRQVVERAAVAADPALVHAVKCWVAARGGRRIDLEDEAGAAIEAGEFTVWELGEAPTGPITTLITLCPSNAEMIAALGLFDRVIACEDSSDYPPEVAACERLGPDLAPDLDRVQALQPSLAIASLSVPGMERVVTGLRARGIPQAVLAPRSLAEVEAEARALGRWLGAEGAAAALCDRLEAERAALLAARPATPLRVYLEWWPRPMFTPGALCYSNELIALAGGVNVFGDRPGSSLEVSPAELVTAAPDLCFVSWCGVAEAKLDPGNLIRRPGLEDLEAARTGRVYPLDEAFAGRPGPRMLEAARRMAAAIQEIARAR